MVKFSLCATVLIASLFVFMSGSAIAQIVYTPPTGAPAPAPAPMPAPTPTNTTPTAPTTSTTPTVPTATAPAPTTSIVTSTTTPTTLQPAPLSPSVSTSTIPGYNASTSSYGPGKTIAYAIAPFAAVAAAYFLTGHHQIEIHPYAGFYWPGAANFGDMTTHLRDEGMYGAKVSALVTDKLELEGNLGYINHFESRLVPTFLDQSFGITQHSVWGLIYDVNGVYNFGKHSVLGNHVTPYVVAGLGGLSTEVRGANATLIGGSFYATDPASGATVFSPTHTVVVRDNTAFLSVNYGGGVKALNLWGPVGLRADIRGRTFPNFRGESLTWPEATAGLTLSWGEK